MKETQIAKKCKGFLFTKKFLVPFCPNRGLATKTKIYSPPCSACSFWSRFTLGNKCAGQHNLKTVHFKETLASGNFLGWSSAKVTEKNRFTGVFALVNAIDAAFIVKNDLVFVPKCFVYRWFDFYSVVPVLANAVTKFRIAVIALAAGVPSITNFQWELLSKQLIQSIRPQKHLRAKKAFSVYFTSTQSPNLYCF